jgi:hypothetical protein
MRQAESLGHLLGVVRMHFEGDVDGRRGLVFVFDFGFGQRRAAVQTPVDRLQALIEIALSRILPSARISSASVLKAIVR